MIKAVFFDFDGTIADTRSILFTIYEKMSAHHDLPEIPYDQIDKIWSMPIRERLKWAGIPLLKLPRLLTEALALFPDFIESAEPYPGIRELLSILKEKGFNLQILSSNRAVSINHFLKNHDLEVFDQIRSAPGLFGKHRIIRNALHDLQISGEEAIYIGDELRDIKSCRKVPIKVIAVTWGYDHIDLLRGADPDYLVDHPREILTILGVT